MTIITDVHTASTDVSTVCIAILLLLLHLQEFPQKADTTHIPLKKDCVLFTVTFIGITIQMIYRLSLHRGGRLEAVCVCVSECVCLCVTAECGNFGRGESPWMYLQPPLPLLLILPMVLLLSDSLLSFL